MIQHIRLSVTITLILTCIFIFPSCRKEGPGGKAKVSGVVAHNGVAIPGARVFIKYGATVSPGTDISQYDRDYACDGSGNYSISSLVQGNYFLYAEGYEVNSLGVTVKYKGGVAVSLTRKQSKQQDIAIE